jgi:hypothetical protein
MIVIVRGASVNNAKKTMWILILSLLHGARKQCGKTHMFENCPPPTSNVWTINLLLIKLSLLTHSTKSAWKMSL